MSSQDFPPDDGAWQARVDSLDPVAYARTRNHLAGAVSELSPYITHGLVSLPQIHERLAQRIGRSLGPQDKLLAEFGWREFFQHVWRHAGERVLTDLRPGLPGVRYGTHLPDEVREGRTGLPVIDQAVRTLYRRAHLHNHARLWLASYLVHLRKVHWRVGADWMLAHLLDGDLASNHLSWQWVAASFSAKPYLFNAENVARWAPPAWHSPGTEIDCSYERLEAIARGPRSVQPLPGAVGPQTGQGPASEPAPSEQPASSLLDPAQHRLGPGDLDAPGVRSPEWIHPWALTARTDERFRLGVLHAGYHRRFPWSPARWRFVITRMRAVCDAIIWLDPAHPGQLQAWRQFSAEHPGCMRSTLSPDYAELTRWPGMQTQPVPRLLPDPDRACPSFSAFYKAATARLTSTPIR